MFCAMVVVFSVLVFNLEGHKIEKHDDILMSHAQVTTWLTAWEKKNDAKLASLEAKFLPPMGFIYIQYGQQFAPTTLWPGASWIDVSKQYRGAFFRAEGGRSRSFGLDQQESTRPFKFQFVNKGKHPPTDISAFGLTPASSYDWISLTSKYLENDKRYQDRKLLDNEFRPYNQAVRIWKRIG